MFMILKDPWNGWPTDGLDQQMCVQQFWFWLFHFLFYYFFNLSQCEPPCPCAIKDTDEHNKHDSSQALRYLKCTGKDRQLRHEK